ncbi:MAG: phytanoyl-CoA dioxygenase family protein [Steroidobacteraceae bacterium]
MTARTQTGPLSSQQGLTERQLASWRSDGYLILRRAFDGRTMHAVEHWTEQLAAAPELPGRHMVYHELSLLAPDRPLIQRIENFYPYHEGLRDLIDGPALLGQVETLFGESAVLFKDKINFKLPGGDGFKPHQDQQAGWSVYAELFITALVAIDPATIENGCLELVTGHHRCGFVGQLWQPLTEAETSGMTFLPCPAEPGDVVFFDSYVPHRSGANLSALPRRALYLTWNRLREGDQRERYFTDKRKSFPPDIEREPGKSYRFRV